MIATKEIKGKEYLFITVPEDAADFNLHDVDNCSKVVFSSVIQDPMQCGGDMINIPLGNYTIIGKGDTLSEEQWKGIAEYSEMADVDEEHDGGYLCYEQNIWKHSTATES